VGDLRLSVRKLGHDYNILGWLLLAAILKRAPDNEWHFDSS
jgi:hypothetical protein